MQFYCKDIYGILNKTNDKRGSNLVKYKRRGLAAILTAAMLLGVCAPAVNAAPAAEDGFLLYDGTAVRLYVDADQTGKTEFAQVQRAAEDVSSDFER